MSIDHELCAPLASLIPLCKADIWSISSERIQTSPRRMEVGYYASEGFRALEAMQKSQFEILAVRDIASIKWTGVFARRFVKERSRGLPFVTTSAMMEARPQPEVYLSKSNTKNLANYTVTGGTILISRSGTVGNVALVSEYIEGWAVTDDAIRVIVEESTDLGPVYCYLQSSLGQFLLQRSQTGSVIRHIYEKDVADLPIPRLPRKLREELTARIREASALRVEANRLLDEAERMVQLETELPDIADFEKLRNMSGHHNAYIFSESNRACVGENLERGRCRLDATSHDPAAVALRSHILSLAGGKRLGDVLDVIRNSNLRKRVYVDVSENGVPLIGGKQLIQLRPTDLNYLSSSKTKGLLSERVHDGWVLVSCGGTVGRVLLVHRNFNNWVMSQHVMRLIPDTKKIKPGYLFAFLSSNYGQIQLSQASYGSVQKEVRDFHFGDIAIAVPDDGGYEIHKKVVRAFDCRADAAEAEDHAFDLFNSAIKLGRPAIEKDWGGDY
jgi:type I restriction enzyme S subunit